MTDQELIKEAREQLKSTGDQFHPLPGYDLLEQLADRLESLTENVESPAVSTARLAEIRRQFSKKELVSPTSSLSRTFGWVRDLLSLYDESEKWCAILANEKECDRGLIQIGVAKALAALETLIHYHRSQRDKTLYEEHKIQALGDGCEAIKRLCGPAPLPPHERLLADNRRMREALEKILCEARTLDLHDANKVIHCQRIARDALGEGF